MNSADWTRDDAHALLDAALNLAACASDAEGELGRLAQAAALTLSRTVASWMVPAERTKKEWEELAEKDPYAWREEVIKRLQFTPGLLPQDAIESLMFGLINLQSRSQPAIFRPVPHEEGRGKDPTTRRFMEQAILVWIKLQTESGRPAQEVQEEAAAAIGRSRRALEDWLQDWRVRDTDNEVDVVMAAAAAYAQGKGVAPPVPLELSIIQFLASARGGQLQALANDWKRTATPKK